MDEIDAYIAAFPEETQARLTAIRHIVRELVPEATERIAYRMPTFDLYGKWLLHFAGYAKFIGFYPHPVGMDAFRDRLTEYKTTKSAVQFPLNKPLPVELIRDMVIYRAKVQEARGVVL